MFALLKAEVSAGLFESERIVSFRDADNHCVSVFVDQSHVRDDPTGVVVHVRDFDESEALVSIPGKNGTINAIVSWSILTL